MHAAALAYVKRCLIYTVLCHLHKPFLQFRGAVVDEIYVVKEYNCLRYIFGCRTLVVIHGTAKNEVQVETLFFWIG
jgi:hypothetical protein